MNNIRKAYLIKEKEKSFIIYNCSGLIELLNFLPKESHLKFIYNNKNEIKKLLYDEDIILILDNKVISNNNYMSDYFYLYEIIIDDKEIINYLYDFELIKKLIERMKAENHNLKKFILYIFAYSILYNYKDSNNDSSSDENKDIYNKIHNEIDEFIKSQQQILKEFDLNLDLLNYKDFNIDNIYAEIIISLIKNKKFDDFKYTKNIMKQLDIQNIELTKEMFNALQKEFNDYSNKEYIAYYKITNEENLLNEKCINFYYILFKYVFKMPFYIYKIQFFLDVQESIKNIIRNNGKILSSIELKKNEEKRNYILIFNFFKLNAFLDSGHGFVVSNKRKSNDKMLNEEEKIVNKILNNKIKINLVPATKVEDIEIIIELNQNDKYFYSQPFFNSCKNYFLNDKECDGHIIFEFLTDFLDRLKIEYTNNSKLIIEMNINKIGNDFEFSYYFNNHFYKYVNNISEETFGDFIDEIN